MTDHKDAHTNHPKIPPKSNSINKPRQRKPKHSNHNIGNSDILASRDLRITKSHLKEFVGIIEERNILGDCQHT